VLKTRNRKQEGLGLPLPGGGVAVFLAGYSRPVLIGEGAIGDHAIDEDVEIQLGDASGVIGELVLSASGETSSNYHLVLSNDHKQAVRVDVEFGEDDGEDKQFVPLSRRVKFGRRNGRTIWSVKVPGNGKVELDFRVTEPD
jgi:hypothetical protein